MTRYLRQMAVPGFGAAQQERLHAARLLVVGAGGLAAPVLQYLVGAGIGRIALVDPDRVSLSNLHRQTLFETSDIGVPKVHAAARHMAALNPDTRIEPIVARLAPDTVAALAGDADLVLDCADSFAVSYILSDHCLSHRLPLISASALGLSGYCGGFCATAPSLRAVFPDLPQRMGNCAEDGVLGPVVGAIGAVQAQMALAVLTEQMPSPLGKLVTYDAADFRFSGFRFDTAPEPAAPWRLIAPADIRAGDFVADLRHPDEGPLVSPNARRIAVSAFGPDGPLPHQGQRAVLCCRSGLRSWQAADRLAATWPGEIVLVALGDTDT